MLQVAEVGVPARQAFCEDFGGQGHRAADSRTWQQTAASGRANRASAPWRTLTGLSAILVPFIVSKAHMAGFLNDLRF